MSRTPSTSPTPRSVLRERSNSVSNSSRHPPTDSSWKLLSQKRCLVCSSLTGCSCVTGTQLDPQERKRRIEALEASTDFGRRKSRAALSECENVEAKHRAKITKEEALFQSSFHLEHEELVARGTMEALEATACARLSCWNVELQNLLSDSAQFSVALFGELQHAADDLLMAHIDLLNNLSDEFEEILSHHRRTRQLVHELELTEEDGRRAVANEAQRSLDNIHDVEIPTSLSECHDAQMLKTRVRVALETSAIETLRNIVGSEHDERQHLITASLNEKGARISWEAARRDERLQCETDHFGTHQRLVGEHSAGVLQLLSQCREGYTLLFDHLAQQALERSSLLRALDSSAAVICGAEDSEWDRLIAMESRFRRFWSRQQFTFKTLLQDEAAARSALKADFVSNMPKSLETEETRLLRQLVAALVYPAFRGYDGEYIRTGVVSTAGPGPLQSANHDALVSIHSLFAASESINARVEAQVHEAALTAARTRKALTATHNKYLALKEKLVWGKDMRRKAEERLVTAKASAKGMRKQARVHLKLARERVAAAEKKRDAARNKLEDLRDRVREKLRGPRPGPFKKPDLGKKRPR